MPAEHIEALEPPKMEIMLPRLDVGELTTLARWAELKREDFPHFAPWLFDKLVAEIARREFEDVEPCMEPLPNWSGTELADALVGSHVLRHFVLSDQQAAYVDHLHLHCLTNAAAALQQFPEWVKL